MTLLEFLRTEAVMNALERAAQCAGTPLSVHVVDRHQEGARVLAWGQCDACRHISTLPEGRRACRQSRGTAAAMALRQQRPMPFICHMGFACVTAPVVPGENMALTFGPYCPAEEARALTYDAARGLTDLTDEEHTEDQLPFSLDDIHRAPLVSVPAITEWLAEVLLDRWQKTQQETTEVAGETPEDDAAPVAPGTGRRKQHALEQGSEMAAALAQDNLPRVRRLFTAQLEELDAAGKVTPAVMRARVTAGIAHALEAMERAGQPTNQAWEHMDAFLKQALAAKNQNALLDAAMKVLQAARKRTPNMQIKKGGYPELDRLLEQKLVEGITLSEVAEKLGETPSAISHRLKRKFGMNFSEYFGRIRVNKAKDLLRRTKLSATDIARRIGINDQSNFSKLFKKCEGISPLEYRARFGSKK